MLLPVSFFTYLSICITCYLYVIFVPVSFISCIPTCLPVYIYLMMSDVSICLHYYLHPCFLPFLHTYLSIYLMTGDVPVFFYIVTIKPVHFLPTYIITCPYLYNGILFITAHLLTCQHLRHPHPSLT